MCLIQPSRIEISLSGGGGDGKDLVWVGWGGGDGRDLVWVWWGWG